MAFRDDKEVKEKMPFIFICVNLEPKNKKERKKSVFCVILGLFRLCIINARKAPRPLNIKKKFLHSNFFLRGFSFDRFS